MALEKELLIKGLGRITKSAAGSQLVYTELTLEEQEIGSIELLAKYPHLHHVQLARNRITDLKPLGSLPNLLTLDLTGNSLTDALDFSTSDNLQRAYLGSNQIRELSSLPQHRHIATLVLSDNKISSLAALSGLKQLRYLDASSNQLTSLAGMCGQPIQELHLSHNRISELSGIETLQELQVVTLNHNKLQTLSPLENNLALYAVEANNNCLDLNPVCCCCIVCQPAHSVLTSGGEGAARSSQLTASFAHCQSALHRSSAEQPEQGVDCNARHAQGHLPRLSTVPTAALRDARWCSSKTHRQSAGGQHGRCRDRCPLMLLREILSSRSGVAYSGQRVGAGTIDASNAVQVWPVSVPRPLDPSTARAVPRRQIHGCVCGGRIYAVG